MKRIDHQQRRHRARGADAVHGRVLGQSVELECQPAERGRNQVEGQKLLGAVKLLNFASEPPEKQHVENDVHRQTLLGRLMQKGVGQHPPDLAVADQIGIETQAIRDRAF